MELRIALESGLLSDDKGSVGEKRHRLAARGAWLLGETFERRKSTFGHYATPTDFASSVLHAGSPKEKDKEDLAKTIGDAQNICREAILRIVRAGAMPDWSDVVIGKGFRREPEDSARDSALGGGKIARGIDR